MMADGRWQFSTRHLKVGDKNFNIYIYIKSFFTISPILVPCPQINCHLPSAIVLEKMVDLFSCMSISCVISII